MRKRQIPSLNMGSMADIAFLLLIFFLVSTTIESDEGITQKLPKWDPNPTGNPTPKHLVLDIAINNTNEFLVNEETADLATIRDKTAAFYTNSGIFTDQAASEDYPQRKWVDAKVCTERLSALRDFGEMATDANDYWQKLKRASSTLGPFKAMPRKAVVNITYMEKTEYATFIEVRNAVQVALNELRDELALENSGKTFDQLSETSREQLALKQAIQAIYPQVISDTQLEQ